MKIYFICPPPKNMLDNMFWVNEWRVAVLAVGWVGILTLLLCGVLLYHKT